MTDLAQHILDAVRKAVEFHPGDDALNAPEERLLEAIDAALVPPGPDLDVTWYERVSRVSDLCRAALAGVATRFTKTEQKTGGNARASFDVFVGDTWLTVSVERTPRRRT